MITISVCNHKGGTGKTTSALHLGAAWGLSGRRTLLIDLDPQAFLTRMLGVKEPPPEKSSLCFFSPDYDAAKLPVHSLPCLDLVPSSGVLSKRLRRLNKPTDIFWIHEALQQPLDYDVVLIDTAAAVTVYSLNAMVASQHVIIPVTPEYLPVYGAEQTYQTAKMVIDKLNHELADPMLLCTQVDGRRRNHLRYRQYLRDRYQDHVLRGIIRTSSALASIYGSGETVFQHNPQSRGALDYANAADEIMGRVDPEDPSKAEGSLLSGQGKGAWVELGHLGG